MCEYTLRISSPVGELTLESDGTSVTALRFGAHGQEDMSCPVLEQAAVELAEYFAGKRRSFFVPLKAEGTPFQCAVWDTLKTIPYGETASYAALAEKLERHGACRAVGGANHRNPLPILIPCHRVIGKNGTLTGYAGGLAIKEFLLRLERENRE